MSFQKLESINLKRAPREEKNVKRKWGKAEEKKWLRFSDMLLILINDIFVFVLWKIMEVMFDKSAFVLETG